MNLNFKKIILHLKKTLIIIIKREAEKIIRKEKTNNHNHNQIFVKKERKDNGTPNYKSNNKDSKLDRQKNQYIKNNK